MRIALAVALVLAACSDPAELPRGSWRSGAWTCLENCGAPAPSIASATWVEISEGTVRWFNAAGGLVASAPGDESGACWTTSTDGATFDVCGCGDCVEVEHAAFGASVWRFDATR